MNDYFYATTEEINIDDAQPVDIADTASTEDGAIKNMISGSISAEDLSRYNKGTQIPVFIYKINSEKLPVIVKSLKITKDKDSYSHTVGKEHKLPDDFVGYNPDNDTEENEVQEPAPAENQNADQPAEAPTDNGEQNTEQPAEAPAEAPNDNTNQEETPAEDDKKKEETTDTVAKEFALDDDIAEMLTNSADYSVVNDEDNSDNDSFDENVEIGNIDIDTFFGFMSESSIYDVLVEAASIPAEKIDKAPADVKKKIAARIRSVIRRKLEALKNGRDKKAYKESSDDNVMYEKPTTLRQKKDHADIYGYGWGPVEMAKSVMAGKGILYDDPNDEEESKYKKNVKWKVSHSRDLRQMAKEDEYFVNLLKSTDVDILEHFEHDQRLKDALEPEDIEYFNKLLNNPEYKGYLDNRKKAKEANADQNKPNKEKEPEKLPDNVISKERLQQKITANANKKAAVNGKDKKIVSIANRYDETANDLFNYVDSISDAFIVEKVINVATKFADEAAKIYESVIADIPTESHYVCEALNDLYKEGVITEDTLDHASLALDIAGFKGEFSNEIITEAFNALNSGDINDNAAIMTAAMINESGLFTDKMLNTSLELVNEKGDEFLSNISSTTPLSMKSQLMFEKYMTEKTLKAKDKKALSDSDYGLPSLKKYPMPDESHVYNAIARFGSSTEEKKNPKFKDELYDNIVKKLKKYDAYDRYRDRVKNDKNFAKTEFGKMFSKDVSTFESSYDLYPFHSNNPYTKEFAVGAMLPMMGSTKGFGTELANSNIEDVVSATNNEIDRNKDNILYGSDKFVRDNIEGIDMITATGFTDKDRRDNSEPVVYETVMPKNNMIFDKEAKALAEKLRNELSDPSVSENISKRLNFRKTIYKLPLKKDADINKVTALISSLKFKKEDESDKAPVFEKEVKDTIITVVVQKNRVIVSYDLTDEGVDRRSNNTKTESVMVEGYSEIDDDIKSVVNKLNRLGYKTRSSCSGHTRSRIKSDGYRDGIKYDKLYTTARIVFDKDYDIGKPKGWKIKNFDNTVGIYPDEKYYNSKDGMPDDAFSLWKKDYMKELRKWVDSLGGGKSDEKEDDDDDVKKESVDDDIFTEGFFNKKIHTVPGPEVGRKVMGIAKDAFEYYPLVPACVSFTGYPKVIRDRKGNELLGICKISPTDEILKSTSVKGSFNGDTYGNISTSNIETKTRDQVYKWISSFTRIAKKDYRSLKVRMIRRLGFWENLSNINNFNMPFELGITLLEDDVKDDKLKSVKKESADDDIFTEYGYIDRLGNHLDDIKKIKDARPNEYSDEKEVKEFVDKHYDGIMKAANLLEKEPADFTKSDNDFATMEILATLSLLSTYPLLVVSAPLAGISALVSFIIFTITGYIKSVTKNKKMRSDDTARHNLKRIRSALKKIVDKKKLNPEYSKKLTELINKIDDVDWSESEKKSLDVTVHKESTDDVFAAMEATLFG